MKIMRDYHNLYLKCDAILLVAVFEKFTNNWLKNNYTLCSRYYLSVPGSS